jgi:tetraacyldisaccharide 4'-kinase
MSILSPLGFLYGKITDARNALYDRGVFASYPLGAKTISIGNITTGGTGKTPLVAHVAGILADAGEKVCILTRGYGRENPRQRVLVSDGRNVLADARTGGDEPVELATKLIEKAVVIVADADRVSAAAWAREKFDITAFVLDDGFQHRRAKRDLDIVCVDATDAFGNGKVLPAGKLREPVENLKRADAIVVTRCDMVDDLSDLKSRISELNPTSATFLAKSLVTNIDLPDVQLPAFAFCGLGNPESFFELLRRNGICLKGTETFPDHHYYTQAEIFELEGKARRCGADVFLTTGKDAVKLDELKFELPCHHVDIQTRIDDEASFRELVISS